MEEQDQLLQKVLAANDTDAVAEDGEKIPLGIKVMNMRPVAASHLKLQSYPPLTIWLKWTSSSLVFSVQRTIQKIALASRL